MVDYAVICINMQDVSLQLRTFMEKNHLNETKLAAAAKVEQSTVSRVLTKGVRRRGKAILRLLGYANITAWNPVVQKGEGTDRVVEAFKHVWDGSEAHASAIAKIIEASADLRPITKTREGE